MASIKPKFYGVKKGRSFIMNDNDKTLLGNFLQKWEDGKELEMTVWPKHKKRTTGKPDEDTNFNGYLWGVVYKIIGDEIGELDLRNIHLWAQLNVGNVKGMPDGKVVPAGTGDERPEGAMSGGEFADYCSRVRIWASAEHNIYIPEPHETDFGN